MSLKYLSSLWRTDEILLVNYEISLQITWSANFVLTDSTGAVALATADTKLYVPVVTLLTPDNTKLLKLLKPWFN